MTSPLLNDVALCMKLEELIGSAASGGMTLRGMTKVLRALHTVAVDQAESPDMPHDHAARWMRTAEALLQAVVEAGRPT